MNTIVSIGALLTHTLVISALSTLSIADNSAGVSSLTEASAALVSPIAVAAAPADNDHDGINDDLEQRLAELYAPVIYIEPDESNYPVNVDWFLARARMQYHEDCTIDVDDDVGPNPIGNQLLGPDSSHYWAHTQSCGSDNNTYGHPPHRLITTVAADPDGQWAAGPLTTGYSDQQTFVLKDLADVYKVGSTDPHDWVTYFHAYPSAEGGIVIQYWHVFAYNQFGGGADNHGGDWDASIQVQLYPDLTLKGVWFSRHTDDHPGSFFYADHVHGNDVRLFNNTHPVVTIDGGGHASFLSPVDWATCQCRVGEDITGPIGTVVWTRDSDPFDDPAALRKVEIQCDIWLNCNLGLSDPSGGVIWKTWTNGGVTASGSLTNPITAPSAHGGLVNLGEYNPCTASLPLSCYGSAQASTLLAGEFHALNNQFWLSYSGRWGSSGRINSGPRGPVFQGFEDRHEGNVSIYRAWYNQGANSPATNDGFHPWLVPPTTTATIGPPSFTMGTATYVTSATNITLSARESAVAGRFGPLTTYFRFYQQGGVLSSFAVYTGPFGLREGISALPDGIYDVQYFSIDALGNAEAVHTITLTLDTMPPPSGDACNGVYGGTFNGNVTVSDGQSCTFFNGGVNGNVLVKPGGTLDLNGAGVAGNVQLQGGGTLITNNSTIGGNVAINGGGTFTIGPGTIIGGDLEIQNVAAGAARNQICGASIADNLDFHNNGAAVDIGGSGCAGNAISADLAVHNNTGAINIFNNVVGDTLRCTANSPAPAGGGNTAKTKQGQCASF